MRSLLLIAALVVLFVHPAVAAPAIHVDTKHDASAGSRVEYRIPPSSALVVDPSGYAWHIPAPLQRKGMKHPTHVNVLVDREHGYMVRWRPGRMVLDRRSLKPMPGRKPFPGFRPGQQVVVGIGVAVKSGGQTKFMPFWAGVVAVQ